MRKLKVTVSRSELSSLTKLFAPWELPLLRAVHGEGNVKVLGEVDDESPYPTSAASEYQRLTQVYPKFEDERGDIQVPIEVCYGRAEGGRMQLGNTIRAAIKDAKSRKPNPPPPEVIAQAPEDVISDGDAIDEDAIDAAEQTQPRRRRRAAPQEPAAQAAAGSEMDDALAS